MSKTRYMLPKLNSNIKHGMVIEEIGMYKNHLYVVSMNVTCCFRLAYVILNDGECISAIGHPDVHGGITFTGTALHLFENCQLGNANIIGWDYGHLGDAPATHDALLYVDDTVTPKDISTFTTYLDGDIEHSLEDVIKDCKDAINQLIWKNDVMRLRKRRKHKRRNVMRR